MKFQIKWRKESNTHNLIVKGFILLFTSNQIYGTKYLSKTLQKKPLFGISYTQFECITGPYFVFNVSYYLEIITCKYFFFLFL